MPPNCRHTQAQSTVSREMENDRKITETPENGQSTGIKDQESGNQNNDNENRKDKNTAQTEKSKKVIPADPDLGKKHRYYRMKKC